MKKFLTICAGLQVSVQQNRTNRLTSRRRSDVCSYVIHVLVVFGHAINVIPIVLGHKSSKVSIHGRV